MKRIVLLGGGHAHAVLLKELEKINSTKVEFQLVSELALSPYSGMLPGVIAKTYSHEDFHLDLKKLASEANLSFLEEKIIKLDLENKLLIAESGNTINYEILSINTGSTPNLSAIKGAKDFAIPVKPIDQLTKRLEELYLEKRKLKLSIIGAGVAGVELAFSLERRLKKEGIENEISLFQSSVEILDTQSRKAKDLVKELLEEKNIKLELNSTIKEITNDKIITARGKSFNSDYTFLTTGASIAPFLKDSGLQITDSGFIEVNRYFQSSSDKDVFAVGDVSSIKDFSRKKAGVYAVRAGKPLLRNLLLHAENREMKAYTPQKHFLAILNTQNGRALATRANFSFYSKSMWLLKDYIDRKFMKQFK